MSENHRWDFLTHTVDCVVLRSDIFSCQKLKTDCVCQLERRDDRGDWKCRSGKCGSR